MLQKLYNVTIYVAGYNSVRELHMFDSYQRTEVEEYKLGDVLNSLIDSAHSDGMVVMDIVIKPA